MASHEFAAKMQAARASAGMSLEQLSELSGTSPGFLSKLERGLQVPEPEKAIRIAVALRADTVELLHAAVRDRLPDDLREHLPTGSSYLLWMRLQDPLLDVDVDRVLVSGNERPDGQVEHKRIYEGLRPRHGAVLREVTLHDPCGASSLPRHAVTRVSPGVPYDFNSSSDSGQRTHKLVFRDGWKERKANVPGFGFAFDCEYPAATSLSGEFIYMPTKRVHRLELTYSMPEERSPESWRARCTYGGSGDERLDERCRSWTLAPAGSRATLAVDEPLAYFTFHLVWEGAVEESRARSARPFSRRPA